MNKQRLEAFSDGVFAIAITLLILDIRLPEVEYNQLKTSLPKIIPNLLSYAMSFIVIGLYWMFHHQYTDRLKRINRPFMFLNLLNLLIISFMPFPTSLLGKYSFTTIPVLIYGFTLMIANLTGFLTVYYVTRHEDLSDGLINKAYLRTQYPMYIAVNSVYLVAFVVAFFAPKISFAMYAGVLGMLIIRALKNRDIAVCEPAKPKHTSATSSQPV